MRRLILCILFCTAASAAIAQQRPTAIQLLSQQLAAAIAQNAELIERVGTLEDHIAALRKQIAERPKEPQGPKPE